MMEINIHFGFGGRGSTSAGTCCGSTGIVLTTTSTTGVWVISDLVSTGMDRISKVSEIADVGSVEPPEILLEDSSAIGGDLACALTLTFDTRFCSRERWCFT